MKFAGPLGIVWRSPATYRDGAPWPKPILDRPPADDADLERWRAAYPDSTCSEKCARLLAGLMRDFAPSDRRSDGTHTQFQARSAPTSQGGAALDPGPVALVRHGDAG